MKTAVKSLQKHIIQSVTSMVFGLLVLIPSVGQTQILKNGDFETASSPSSFAWFNILQGQTVLNDWTVDSGEIDHIMDYWTSQEGTYSIDLNGYGPGAISQTFPTTIGAEYLLEFWLAGNPAGGPIVKTLEVAVSDLTKTVGFDGTGKTITKMGWIKINLDFIAKDEETTLTFRSLVQGSGGPALDNISVILISEPQDTGRTDTIPSDIATDTVGNWFEAYFPTAFSPNNDGLNEVYRFVAPKGLVERVNSFQIFNMWGERVFDKKDFLVNNETLWWDGKINGYEAQMGLYTYIVELKFSSGTMRSYDGNFLLKR